MPKHVKIEAFFSGSEKCEHIEESAGKGQTGMNLSTPGGLASMGSVVSSGHLGNMASSALTTNSQGQNKPVVAILLPVTKTTGTGSLTKKKDMHTAKLEFKPIF